jgi:CRISPR-associated protein Csx14
MAVSTSYQNATQPVNESALIVTLGGKPQLVTFSLDHLLDQGVRITRVAVVHLSTQDPRIHRSLEMIAQEFRTHRRYSNIRFESHLVREVRLTSSLTLIQDHPIASSLDRAATDAIWMTWHRLISALKSTAIDIELCLAGGPRLLALMGLSAASLLFGSQDRCWHLHTADALRVQSGDGAILHAPNPADVHLIPVPMLPMGRIFPHLQSAAYLSPQQIIDDRAQQVDALEMQRCLAVHKALSPREREVLREFARDGADPASVAKKLHIEIATLDSHKRNIFAECRNAWEMPAKARLTHHFLREKFGRLTDDFWEK